MPNFAQAASKYNDNENEFIPGEIGIWLNRMENGRVNTSYGDDGFINYRFYKPTIGSGKRPLFIWLHGNDGRRIPDGREGWFAETNGVAPEFLQNYGSLIATGGAPALVSGYTQQQYGGFFVLAIQAPNGGVTAPGYMDVINALLSSNPDIDTSRIYIAGHSMGGSGTTTMVNAYPDFFAAAMTAAGGRIDEEQAKVWNTPAWFWHNRADSNGGVQTIINYNLLKNAGFDNVRLTYYPSLGYMNGINAAPTPEVESLYAPATDRSGDFGSKDDPVITPGQQNPWGHSVFEPMMTNKETVDGPWNVGFTNKDDNSYTGTADNGGRRRGYVTFQWGVKNALDTASDTVFDWVFKQQRK
jgi:poly(3-hydroxybutyrate) depolymerase